MKQVAISIGGFEVIANGFLDAGKVELYYSGMISPEIFVLTATITDGALATGYRVAIPYYFGVDVKEVTIHGISVHVLEVSKNSVVVAY